MMENTFQIEKWEDLTFANNFLFCKILESEPDLCKQLLELLLHIEIDHLEIPQSERTLKETIDSKSVRFDVYTKGDNKIFDIEIQTTNKKNLPKRSRYYQSIIDMSNLNAGTDYDELNDRAFKLFFNASDYDKLSSDEQKSFFKFLKGESAETDFTKQLKDKIAIAKKNAEWRMQYMTWEQTLKEEHKIAYKEAYEEAYKEAYNEAYNEVYNEAYNEVYNEASRAKAIENARNFLSEGISPEVIARCCSLPLEQVLALKEELSAQTVKAN